MPKPENSAGQRALGSSDLVGDASLDETSDLGGHRTSSPERRLPVEDPAVIGEFEIRERLGSGAFGVVYLGWDARIEREVAVKVLHSQPGDSLVAPLEEARAQASVDHVGIVPIYQVGELPEGNGFYIVSKYLPGGTLSHWLARQQGRLPIEQATSLVISIAEALHAAHQAELIHRDLKPGNILLDDEGRPFISDFGLALRESEQANRRGEVSGTPNYMAPEQVEGRAHHLDGRADIWALGVMLYEMLTGARPFSGKSTTELFEEITERDPKPVRWHDKQIPVELEDIVSRCLRKSPADRTPTAECLSEELRAFRARLTRSNSRRLQLAIGLVAVPVCLWVGWVIANTAFPEREPVAKPVAEPNTDEPPRTDAEAMENDVSQLEAKVSIRVWGDGKRNMSIDDRAALPLKNGDRVRFDVELTEEAHVYLVWIDADGIATMIFPDDPELGDLGDKRRKSVHSPADLQKGWPVVGAGGMDTAAVLVRRTPIPQDYELLERMRLRPEYDFHSPQELVSYRLTSDDRIITAGPAPTRGLGDKPEVIDDPILALLKKLRDDFAIIRVVRVAHAQPAPGGR